MGTFAKLLADFGATTGIPSLAADSEGYCILELDEKVVLVMQYEQETESIVFYTDLGKYPRTCEQAVFFDILQANCLWAGTGGTTLGINAENNSVLMCYRLQTLNLEPETFERTIESFTNTAEYWTGRIEALGRDDTGMSISESVPMGIRV